MPLTGELAAAAEQVAQLTQLQQEGQRREAELTEQLDRLRRDHDQVVVQARADQQVAAAAQAALTDRFTHAEQDLLAANRRLDEILTAGFVPCGPTE